MARIDPYTVLLFHNVCHITEKTEDMKRNIEHVVEWLKSMVGTPGFAGRSGYAAEIPIKLIALPESFCQGWPDMFFNIEHVEACNRVFNTTIPGPETDMLGELAEYTGAYIMGTMQARDPELMEDRYFNTGFIINPEGKVIYKRHKTSFIRRERSTSPTDIWDRYIEKYGDDPKALMDAIYPVAKTEIGNLAVTICGEGDKPEVFRALGMNGAEIVARLSYPFYDRFELQNRAHAHFNNMYIIGANGGVMFLPGRETPLPGFDTIGHVIDYRGRIIAKNYPTTGEAVAIATINIEELRYTRFHELWQNWLPQLRMEEYILPYQYALDVGGFYPKNLAMDEPPMPGRPHDDILRWCVNRAAELGMWTPPDGWEPFKIPKEIRDKIAKAKARPTPKPARR